MKKFLPGFNYAFKGIRLAFATERNFRIYAILTVIAVAIGIYLGLSAVKWSLVIFAIGLVLTAELFNTSIERIVDEIAQGKRSQTSGNIKDIAAGAVLISAITALVVGIIILIVPFIQKIISIL